MMRRQRVLGQIRKWVETAQRFWNFPTEFKIQQLRKKLPKYARESTSWSDSFEAYREVSTLAAENDEVFSLFKRSLDYQAILEHVTRRHGRGYLKLIQQDGKDLLGYFQKFKENDLLGNPYRYHYGNGAGKFSPTTLRYIKVLMDLRNMFGNLNDASIVEIGGGYGGQCKIISDVVSFGSYTIVDLEEVLPLIQKVLKNLSVRNAHCLTSSQLNDRGIFDLVISNYAFSECNRKVQEEYLTKILLVARRGYMTYNYNGSSHSGAPYNKDEIVARLSQVHTVEILDEKPITAPQNFILVWDDTKRPWH